MPGQSSVSNLHSPSDLINFLEGDFAAWMDRQYAEHLAGGSARPFRHVPDKGDAEGDLIKRLGEQHETAVLDVLRARYGDCVTISRNELAEEQTIAAMRSGRPLIYQGHLSAPGWHGYPDFLIKTDTPSQLGPWAYWPIDSKLARSVRPYFLIQLCAYAEFLERAQGHRPETLGFIFGNRVETTFNTARYFYFYRHLKDAFGRFQQSFNPSSPPDPALEVGFGRWEAAAKEILEERDDVRLTARITRSQVKRLRAAGVRTCAGLVASSSTVPRINTNVLDRLRRQARLQIASRGSDVPAYEVLAADAGSRAGLAALPPESHGDVYLDLEGFPLTDTGLEYLIGAVTVQDGAPTFRDWWAHDAGEEKTAFERVVDWLHQRWKADTAMHIYHYASYEVTALRRLMGKYATRENELDDLLRGEAFVDLLAVTRGGVAVGTPGYSLKDIEVLFSPTRTAAVTDAGSSIVEYQRWMDSGEPRDWRQSPTLTAIRAYNREDCESTWRLASWLRRLQSKHDIHYVPVQPAPESEAQPTVQPEEALAEGLLARAEREQDPDRKRVTQLVAWLLNYYRRENKPMWWRYFDRLTATEEDLFNDPDCLAGLVRTETPPTPVKRSLVVEYRFDPEQDTKLQEGDNVYVVSHGEPTRNTIVNFDADHCLVRMKFGPSKAIPDHCSLIPDDHVSTDSLRDSVLRFAERWQRGDMASAQAIDDLLFRRAPRLLGGPREILLEDGAQLPDGLVRLTKSLDHTTLCVQGPPGSGKTHNSAAVIVALAATGARIGVSSNSHKAILNLLDAVAAEATRRKHDLKIVKARSADEDASTVGALIRLCQSKEVAAELEQPGVVLGGTAWAFARPELEQRLDYLFIDEAGQVSLANAIAMGLAARNLVLIGDQMQLSQPAQGSHPGQSGLSCLHYLLEGHATVPPNRGVLLPTTWRLHPDICRFISDSAYDGRLTPHETTSDRRIVLPKDAVRLRRGTGIHFEELHHEGNTQASHEEAEAVALLVGELERSEVVDSTGSRRFERVKDLLIVAPYNAQVRVLRERLGADLRIASVDKFQGQEATVVIASMSASSVEETPRGAAFLLSPSRLNVAISRARCLAVVVASSDLIRTRPASVQEMELLNLYCRLRFYALELTGSS